MVKLHTCGLSSSSLLKIDFCHVKFQQYIILFDKVHTFTQMKMFSPPLKYDITICY